MKKMLGALPFIAICSLVFGWASGAPAEDGEDRQLANSQHASITIPGCRLQLVNEVKLAAEQSGILDQVATPGNFVTAGDQVALLRDLTTRATLAILEKEVENDIEVRFAQKAQQLAQLKYERAVEADRALNGTVTEFELRELRLAAEKALLQLEQAEHQMAIAELRRREQLAKLQSHSINAPFNGIVRAAHKRPGEVVSEGEVVVELVNTNRIRVYGYVNSQDALRVAAGDPVQIRLEGNPDNQGMVFNGRVTFVDVKVEPVANKVKVCAEVQNQQKLLRDGLTATMRITPTGSVAHQNH